MTSYKVLIAGRTGQVASALRNACWPESISATSMGRGESFDLADGSAVHDAVKRGGWAAVVNAAAYTAVDEAEAEPRRAYEINRDGAAVLAEACADAGIPLVHLSTDFVFDGAKLSPYTEADAVNPLSTYGASKAAGEQEIRNRLARHVILRTAWVFSATGSNFVRSMLRLGAERDELGIVEDQTGCPTPATDIARAVVEIVTQILHGRTGGFGTWHFAGGPAVSWFGFAQEIFRQARLRGFAPRAKIVAIPSSDYPTPATRPRNSALDVGRFEQVYGMKGPDWRIGLGAVLDELLGEVRRAPENKKVE